MCWWFNICKDDEIIHTGSKCTNRQVGSQTVALPRTEITLYEEDVPVLQLQCSY